MFLGIILVKLSGYLVLILYSRFVMTVITMGVIVEEKFAPLMLEVFLEYVMVVVVLLVLVVEVGVTIQEEKMMKKMKIT